MSPLNGKQFKVLRARKCSSRMLDVAALAGGWCTPCLCAFILGARCVYDYCRLIGRNVCASAALSTHGVVVGREIRVLAAAVAAAAAHVHLCNVHVLQFLMRRNCDTRRRV